MEAVTARTQHLGRRIISRREPDGACYASIGFIETGERETYSVNGEEWPCIEMECREPKGPREDTPLLAPLT